MAGKIEDQEAVKLSDLDECHLICLNPLEETATWEVITLRKVQPTWMVFDSKINPVFEYNL